MSREPAYCTYCGCFSWLDEWGVTGRFGADEGPDVCPACRGFELPASPVHGAWSAEDWRFPEGYSIERACDEQLEWYG